MNEVNRNAVFAALDSTGLAQSSGRSLIDEQQVPLFRQYLLIAVRWRRIIGATIVGFVIAGLIVTFLMTPKYTATTRLDIAREGNRIAPIQGVEKETTDADLEFYQTQYGLLQSRALAEKIADELRLTDDPSFFKIFGKRPVGTVGEVPDGRPLPATKRLDRRRQVAALLLKNVSISPVRLSRLVDISFTSPDANLSQRVANAWASNFIGITLERRFEATAYARKFLEGRLEQLRARLETSEREVVNYAAQQQIVDLPVGGVPGTATSAGSTSYRSIIADNLSAINAELNSATGDRVAAQARLQNTGEGASPEALQNSAIAGLRQKRAELSADYQKLLVQFEPSYPTARALKTQINQLDASISREESRVTASLRNVYRDSVTRERQLESKVSALKSSLLDLRRRSIQYNIFQRDADTNRQLYDALLQRYKEIGVAGGVGVNNIAVVDPADFPDRPSSPRLLLNLLLSFIAGVVASAGIAFVLEQSAESFDDPGELDRILRVPLLGTIPMTSNHETPVDALRDRKSHLVEAYLSVETNLRFSTDHGLPRSLSVTSTRPGEGKSTTSLALATLLGRIGKKVILVDGDMRSPSVHQLLDMENVRGLSDYLTGVDQLDTLTTFSTDLGIWVMTSGPLPPNAAELLNGERLERLVAVLGDQFDHIVIDSPPVMGLADAPLIGSCVEGTVFAVESHGIRSSLARVAISRLRSANVHVFGALLTKFESKRAHFGYGYQYGYSYGQAHAEKPAR